MSWFFLLATYLPRESNRSKTLQKAYSCSLLTSSWLFELEKFHPLPYQCVEFAKVSKAFLTCQHHGSHDGSKPKLTYSTCRQTFGGSDPHHIPMPSPLCARGEALCWSLCLTTKTCRGLIHHFRPRSRHRDATRLVLWCLCTISHLKGCQTFTWGAHTFYLVTSIKAQALDHRHT